MTDIKKTPIPQRLKNVSNDHPYVAGSVDIYDDVKKKSQQDVNADVDATFELHQSEINALDSQNYYTVEATNEDTTIGSIMSRAGVEPQIDTVYRVGFWDGTEYDESKYSEYAWNEADESWKLLDVKEYTIATASDFIEPDAQKRAKVVSVGAAADVHGQYEESTEYIYVITDGYKRILAGIKPDGSVSWAKGVPTPVRDFVLQSIESMIECKVDKEEGKSLIDSQYSQSVSISENQQWSSVETDSYGRILSGTRADGSHYFADFDVNVIKSAQLYLQEYIAVSVFDPTSKSVIDPPVIIEVDLVKDTEYSIESRFVSQPVADSRVNTWLYKRNQEEDVYLERLAALSDSNTVNIFKFTPSESGRYVIKYRALGSVYPDANVEVSIKNPYCILDNNKKNTGVLPEYYDGYLSERALDMQEAIIGMSRGDVFGFVTDTHPMNRNNVYNGSIFKSIASKIPLNKIFFGGDVGPSDATCYGEETKAKEGLSRSIMQQTERLYAPCREAGCSIYQTRGNHDYACTDNVGAVEYGSGYQASMKATRQMLFAYADNAVTNADDANSLYYYFDNKVQKIRYIVADTSDSGDYYDPEHMISNVDMKISDTQIKWIVEQAILTTPSDYKIIFMSHVIPSAVGYAGPGYPSQPWSSRSIYNLNHIVAAIQNNETVTITLRDSSLYTCDFRSFAPKVIMYVAGHLHYDSQTYENGTLFYASSADWYTQQGQESRVEKQLFDIIVPIREYGTVTENLENVIIIDIDNSKIRLFRLGSGVDKVFNISKVTLNVGEDVTLTSEMEDSLQWASYDAKILGPSHDDVFSHTITEVDSSSGTVTGLAAGESVVVAYSESTYKMEFFDIVVI